MSNRLLNLIAGDYNSRQLKKLDPILTEINHLYTHMHDMTDAEIQAKTAEFKSRYQAGESLDAILPEAFAVVKQAAKRMTDKQHTANIKGNDQTWNMVHYDVQLIGGIVLHQGNIAEMKTGEGKTLVATLAVYLNAITGKGVHVVTVNDYLASRDGLWMGELYKRLGLSIGIVTKHTSNQERRAQYEADITYVENSELGFDYLRDNLSKTMEERVMLWRPLHYAIVDEVDSILIDEARTPMIISQASDEATEKYAYYAKLVALLTPSTGKKKVSKGFLHEIMNDEKQKSGEENDLSGDYYIDEKLKTVTLSSDGIAKLEKMLNVENLYRDIGYGEIHHIENALKAHAVYHLDKEYLVRNGEVLIVDDHTGRVMPGRRYSQGLHQAIEAKEGVEVQRESKTLATITYQHFFGLYEKIAGMTGTATTEAEEFENIYKLETITIPTNKDTIRVDKNDAVYFNQQAKWAAVVDHIKFYHEVGVPILIGTSSIQTSELMSNILRQMNYAHTVLNAKFHEQEANIISNAGKKGSLVVATNMAGRGTDIKLADGLFQDIANNYATYIAKKLQKSEAITVTIYSEREYQLFIEGLKNTLHILDEGLPKNFKNNFQAKFDELGFEMSFSFSGKKKTKEDVFATIKFSPVGESSSSRLSQETELEQRDIHFGLYILGTEKHDSRRIDNQLRGRAGRQGDPGISQFFVAFDDEIMRKMGGEKIQTVARMMMKQDELEKTVFTQSQFTNSIARAQKQMEARHFSTRKHLFEYDSVINKQRTRIYEKRDEILNNLASRKSKISSIDIGNKIILIDAVKCLINSNENYDFETRNLNSELLKQLKLLPNRKVIVTNAADEKRQWIKDQISNNGLDRDVFSYMNDPAKSNPQYFEFLINHFEKPATEYFYIDHKQENLDAAAQVGITGELYKNNNQIINTLKSLTTNNGKQTTVVSLNALDEIKSFIPEIVTTIVKSHQGIPEAIETLSQITGMSFLEDELVGLNDSQLIDKLTSIIESELAIKISDYDQTKIVEYLSKVYLRVIDKHWMNHIDEMQNLREKVGLYGYAQIDPLVIYKKESFEKFQSLLNVVKQETLSQALKTDYHQAMNTAVQLSPAQEEALDEKQVIHLLKELTQGVDSKTLQGMLTAAGGQSKTNATNNGNLQKLATDDIEILEIDEEKQSSSSLGKGGRGDLVDIKSLRPNDKVNVRWNNGKIEYDVKWKKVQDEVKKGEGTVF